MSKRRFLIAKIAHLLWFPLLTACATFWGYSYLNAYHAKGSLSDLATTVYISGFFLTIFWGLANILRIMSVVRQVVAPADDIADTGSHEMRVEFVTSFWKDFITSFPFANRFFGLRQHGVLRWSNADKKISLIEGDNQNQVFEIPYAQVTYAELSFNLITVQYKNKRYYLYPDSLGVDALHAAGIVASVGAAPAVAAGAMEVEQERTHQLFKMIQAAGGNAVITSAGRAIVFALRLGAVLTALAVLVMAVVVVRN